MEKKTVPMRLNADGVTFRFGGAMQAQMSVDQQKKAGLIAARNKSITGREVKGGGR